MTALTYQVNSTNGLTLRIAGSAITYNNGDTFVVTSSNSDVDYYFSLGKLKLITSSTSASGSSLTVTGTVSGPAGGPPGPQGIPGLVGPPGPPGPTGATSPASTLATTGAAVDVSAASPPTSGQFLKATGATTATWQTVTLGTTLDGAYDFGGAGAGRSITADTGAVAITNDAANNNAALTLSKQPVGVQTSPALLITASNCDYGIRINGASSLTAGLAVNSSTISCPSTSGTAGERFGLSSVATGNNTLALGNAASASVANATAIGKGASAAHAGIALGIDAATQAANQLVIGSDTVPLTTIAFGRGFVSGTAISAVTLKGSNGTGAGIAGAGLSIEAGVSGDAATASGNILFKVANAGSGTTTATALRINGTDSRVAVGTSVPLSLLDAQGSMGEKVASSAITATAGEAVAYLMDSSSGTIALNLPLASTCAGRKYLVKKIAAANTVNVTPTGGDTIDGSGSAVALTTQWSSVEVRSDGVSWFKF